MDDPALDPAAELVAVLEQVGRGEVSLADGLRIEGRGLEDLVDRALALAGAGKNAEAEALLEVLTRVDPRSAMLPFLLASVLAESGRAEEAVAAAERALALEAEEPSTAPFRGEVLLLIGRAHLALGATPAAKEALEWAATLDGPARAAARATLQRMSS